ncbi:MAG: hypothetical protein P4L35_18075 [Ignavibacteriaceae bacterium]|nr:hypothetical protein [Ignavibacteriaceae bacterium]
MARRDSPADIVPKNHIHTDSNFPEEIGSSFISLENQLRLYSISKAASILHINEESLNELIDMGQIGYLLIGKRKKIPYQELIRYEKNNLILEKKSSTSEPLSPAELDRMLQGKKPNKNKTFNPREILNLIMKEKNHGHCKKTG